MDGSFDKRYMINISNIYREKINKNSTNKIEKPKYSQINQHLYQN